MIAEDDALSRLDCSEDISEVKAEIILIKCISLLLIRLNDVYDLV